MISGLVAAGLGIDAEDVAATSRNTARPYKATSPLWGKPDGINL